MVLNYFYNKIYYHYSLHTGDMMFHISFLINFEVIPAFHHMALPQTFYNT